MNKIQTQAARHVACYLFINWQHPSYHEWRIKANTDLRFWPRGKYV